MTPFPFTALAFAKAMENAAAMPKKPIPMKGVRLTKSGKLEKTDKAPPHVRAGRRRKAGKITGAKAAK